MDREEIERRDFPAARRGYDAAAVGEHLRRVADEFEALARRQAPASLAEGASTRVQAIIEAAETTARQLRDDAGREASGHVGRVADAADQLLARIEALQDELDRLLGGLRESATSLTGSLDALQRDVGTIGRPAAAADAPSVGPAAEPRDGAADALSAGPSVEPHAAAAGDADAAAPPAPVNGARSDDEAGARLVALNMALEGAPREATGRYLADHYELDDLDALLDAVYASAGR